MIKLSLNLLYYHRMLDIARMSMVLDTIVVKGFDRRKPKIYV